MIHSIIDSIIDTDLYKFSMGQAILFKFPYTKVEYTFINRNDTKFPKNFDKELNRQIKYMEMISLKSDERKFLKSISFLSPAYIDFLNGYRFDSSELNIWQDNDGRLNIKITGMWYRIVYWEVPLLSIISELYFIMSNQIVNINMFDLYDIKKMRLMEEHNAYFSDFGTRRRFSYANQDRIIGLFAANKTTKCFVGTSNVHFAMKHKIKAIGTMAHEWIMTHGALYGYRMANKLALDNWSDVYGGDLGTALTDTYTTTVFLKSFDMMHAKLWDGCRQDSGNPFDYVDKIINHYKNLRIDPMSKTIIFSNALDIDTAIKIKEYCVGKIKSAFGIGTNLSNDVGVKPLNMVIKLTKVKPEYEDWINVVKLSDDKGKNTGDKKEIENCKQILGIC